MYSNIDIFFSSICNMNCQYCYIEKEKKKLFDNNEKIIEKIKNGTFVKNLIINCPEEINNVESISLWGMEPTLNAEYFELLFKQLIENFPNFKECMFSTNSFLGWEKLRLFTETVQNNNKNEKFKFVIQFSIDGPEWINENSRLKGATQRTLDTIYTLCDNIPENLNYNLILQTKPTLDVFYMKKMVEQPSLLEDYCNFFDTLEKTAYNKVKNKEKVKLYLGGSPTLVDPGEHTIEDGKIFAQWLKLINDTDSPIDLRQPFFALREMSWVRDDFDYSTKPWVLNCGAGRGSVAMTCDGEVFSCHRFFKDSITNDSENIAINSYSTLKEKIKDNDYSRLNYLNSLLHNYHLMLHYVQQYEYHIHQHLRILLLGILLYFHYNILKLM